MSLTLLVLVTTLAADVGAVRDGGVPLWVPPPYRTDVEDSATYGLRRYGKGYLWENQQFEAQVAPDGLVTFKAKHGSVVGSLLGFKLFSKNEQGRDRKPGMGAAPYLPGPLTKGARGTAPPPPAPEENERTIDQTVRCPEHSGCETPPQDRMISIVNVRGTFDLTDEIMRGLGKDPYRLEKARFLSATFEFRIKLAIEFRKQNLKRALDHLPQYLDDLWGDGRYSARERRRILYELWIEMDRTPEGERAARLIQDFVGRRLPCGNADGYTPEERRAFGKKRDGRTFLDGHGCGK